MFLSNPFGLCGKEACKGDHRDALPLSSSRIRIQICNRADRKCARGSMFKLTNGVCASASVAGSYGSEANCASTWSDR